MIGIVNNARLTTSTMDVRGNMSNKLFPCPFCGEEVEVLEHSNRFTVRCKNKKCFLKNFWYKKEELTEVWNTRFFDKDVLYAIERNKPKKLNRNGNHTTCATCGRTIYTQFPSLPSDFQFCSNCGQRLAIPKKTIKKAEKEMIDFVRSVREEEMKDMLKENDEQSFNEKLVKGSFEENKETFSMNTTVGFGQHRAGLSGLKDTVIAEGSKKYLVSTEKIGEDLYETKVFNYRGEEVNYLIDIYCERYSSESKAIARHYELVKIINENEKCYNKIRYRLV